jgi:NAD(P)-dependent dehydrogenase (short-subunit alcohol dehydrogenase family)
MIQKRVIVTGATDGIGLITARRLAEQGAEVGLVARNADKGAVVVERLKRETDNPSIRFFKADLSRFDDVRAVAGEIATVFPKLDVLVNNAGAMFMDRQLSVDGYEMTFALNHLSVFLLTNLLTENLLAADKARVLTVASVAHRGSDLDFDDLDSQKAKHSGWRSYQRSKLANILFTRELAKRFEGTGATANCLHPGFVASRFGENNGPVLGLVFKGGKLFAISPEKGAETSVFLASADKAAGETGGYFTGKKRGAPSRQASNEETARKLWDRSAEMTGLQTSI